MAGCLSSQVKHGNWAPRAPAWKPEKYTPEHETAKDTDWVDNKEAEELADLEDEFSDDRAMEEYRKKRLAELKAATARPLFGQVRVATGHVL